MKAGTGHHGEPGIDVRATASAAEMAQLMLDVVLPDLPFGAGDRVAVLISGLGATPVMEQYILYGEIAQRLLARGITVAFNQVGNLFTSLEMMGVTLTLMKLDDELETCLKHPCRSVGLSVPGDAAQGRTYSGSARMHPAVATAAAASGAGGRARTVCGGPPALAGGGSPPHPPAGPSTSSRLSRSPRQKRSPDHDHSSFPLARRGARCNHAGGRAARPLADHDHARLCVEDRL